MPLGASFSQGPKFKDNWIEFNLANETNLKVKLHGLGIQYPDQADKSVNRLWVLPGSLEVNYIKTNRGYQLHDFTVTSKALHDYILLKHFQLITPEDRDYGTYLANIRRRLEAGYAEHLQQLTSDIDKILGLPYASQIQPYYQVLLDIKNITAHDAIRPAITKFLRNLPKEDIFFEKFLSSYEVSDFITALESCQEDMSEINLNNAALDQLTIERYSMMLLTNVANIAMLRIRVAPTQAKRLHERLGEQRGHPQWLKDEIKPLLKKYQSITDENLGVFLHECASDWKLVSALGYYQYINFITQIINDYKECLPKRIVARLIQTDGLLPSARKENDSLFAKSTLEEQSAWFEDLEKLHNVTKVIMQKENWTQMQYVAQMLPLTKQLMTDFNPKSSFYRTELNKYFKFVEELSSKVNAHQEILAFYNLSNQQLVANAKGLVKKKVQLLVHGTKDNHLPTLKLYNQLARDEVYKSLNEGQHLGFFSFSKEAMKDVMGTYEYPYTRKMFNSFLVLSLGLGLMIASVGFFASCIYFPILPAQLALGTLTLGCQYLLAGLCSISFVIGAEISCHSGASLVNNLGGLFQISAQAREAVKAQSKTDDLPSQNEDFVESLESINNVTLT